MKCKVSDRPMRIRGHLRAFAGLLAAPCLMLCVSAARVGAQDPDPADWDLEIRTDKAEYAVGETVSSTTGIVARVAGVQGWSYGVSHDSNVLVIESVSSAGTDTEGVFDNGFDQTSLEVCRSENPDPPGEPCPEIEENVGYIQAIVLSFINPAEVPVSDYFSMASATYTVAAGACDGQTGDFETSIDYAKDLGVPNSPPVDINLTVGGKGVLPDVINSAALMIQCEPVQPPGDGLALAFDESDTDLVADQTEVYDLMVLLENLDDQGGIELLGWSYGITIDTGELEALSGEPGADSAALLGGSGPEFTVYNLGEQNVGGTLDGITVGAVIELNPPGAPETLAIPATESRHVDTIQLRSAQVIAPGEPSRTTEIGFSDMLGDPAVEAIATDSGGDTLPLDITSTLLLTLTSGEVPDRPQFIRGDSNNDTRVDISDGIWIINWLYYGGAEPGCRAAADSNDDGARDLSDAVYIFNFQLQPGADPGSLFPAPPAPFPTCGTDPDVTEEDCPMGSTTCME